MAPYKHFLLGPDWSLWICKQKLLCLFSLALSFYRLVVGRIKIVLIKLSLKREEKQRQKEQGEGGDGESTGDDRGGGGAVRNRSSKGSR